jgi:AcrR family transcriptional regulator
VAAQAVQRRPLRRDAEANRRRIVAAARAAFAAGGIDAPVEEIARRAGVGMGTLYRRFPTKDDLVDAVLEETFAEFVAAAEDALGQDDAWAGLCTFLERVFELHVANRGVKDVVITYARGRRQIEAHRRRMRPLVSSLIDRAREQGALRPDFVAEDVPPLLWAGARVIEATVDVAPDYWRRHLGLVLDGLRAGAVTLPLPGPPLAQADLDRVARRRSR